MEAWFWSWGIHILFVGSMLFGFYMWLFHTDHTHPRDYKLEELRDINKILDELKIKCQS